MHDLLRTLPRYGDRIVEEDLRRMAFRIARGVVVDAIRSARQRLRIGQPGPGLGMDGALNDRGDRGSPTLRSGDHLESDRLTHERIAAALATLDRDDHMLITLRSGGASWPQVSQAMGVTTIAVRKKWERLRQRLSSELRSLDTE